jgi:hypothetical protein
MSRPGDAVRPFASAQSLLTAFSDHVGPRDLGPYAPAVLLEPGHKDLNDLRLPTAVHHPMIAKEGIDPVVGRADLPARC